MNEETKTLVSAAVDLSNIAVASLLTVFWVSLVSIALLQFFKQLFPLRSRFQRRQILLWLFSGISGVENEGKNENSDEFLRLVDLSAAGGTDSLFSLPADQLSGQIGVAAQIVFENPEKYSKLLHLLARGIDEEEISKFKEDKEPVPSRMSLINNQIQRNIDRLYVDLGRKWRLYMRSSIMLISTVLLFLVMAQISGDLKSSSTLILLALIPLAGYMGPVIYDIISRLQGE